MYNRYPNLLSPIKIGGLTVRNRMISSLSEPHFLQGPENYPGEALITHYGNKAKAGAGIVACGAAKLLYDSYQTDHFPTYHFREGAAQNMMSQVAEAVHFYGAKCEWIVNCPRTPGYDAGEGIPSLAVEGDGSVSSVGQAMSEAMIAWLIEDYAEQARLLKSFGVDMVFIHCAYRMFTPARFLSPLTNNRKDQFGGPIENRARVLLMIAERIKEVCGRDFPIEASISAYEPEGGYTFEDTLELAKLAEGKLDMLQIRTPEIDPLNPIGYSEERYPTLKMARALKRSGTTVKIVTIGGYFDDFQLHDDIIKNGDADLIGMARSWISNPRYGDCVYEGTPEELVPCIKCNKCHFTGPRDPWLSACSVNPVWGIEWKADRMVSPVQRIKKVAVVGGGPAGMQAALIAATRGHRVTLFEKSDSLGGQLKHADFATFKWPLRDFKDYLVRQVGKHTIEVRLGVEATPELLQQEMYDDVVMAIGASPLYPRIPGVQQGSVVPAIEIFGKHERLAEKVVVVGGGEVGVDTGMYLARNGHKVVVLEMQDDLALDASPVHYRALVREAWQQQEGFGFIVNATCTAITETGVRYKDLEGIEHCVEAGSVVIATGMTARSDEAWSFAGSGGKVHLVGDCDRVGSVQTAIRSSFGIMSMI